MLFLLFFCCFCLTAPDTKKKKGENKTSESIAALRFANLARPNSYLFTLFRFDVHKLVHCNRGEAIGQSRLGTRAAARHSSRFPSSRKNELVYAGEKKAEKKKHALLISSDTAKSSSPPNFCNTLDTSSFVWPVISISVLMVVFSVFPPMMMSYTR